jgi:hypothetical protein
MLITKQNMPLYFDLFGTAKEDCISKTVVIAEGFAYL